MKPDDLLKALLSKNPRSERKTNLTSLHEICKYQADNNPNNPSAFSIAEIGRICEARGLFKARTLYNQPAEDYRNLIQAWASHAMADKSSSKVVKKSDDIERFLLKIDDFAIRSRIQILIAENKKLQNQVNICKKNMGLVIDQRPSPIGPRNASGDFTVVEVGSSLTAPERDALAAAISPEFMEENDFKLGTSGEVYFKTGRVLYDPGYVSAIKKVIGK